MHSITEHDNPPYIQIEVFGRYDDQYAAEFQRVVIRYGETYPAFCAMEVQHGRISNGLWRLLQTGGQVDQRLIDAMRKLRRIAIVGDEPGLMIRLVTMLPKSGGPQIRLFRLHELDEARAWMRLA